MAIIRTKPIKREAIRLASAPVIGADSASVLSIAAKHGITTTPLDIERLLKLLGLKLKRRPLDDEVSGHLSSTNEGWVITVNSLHHPNRQRFTLAHELGHYILHRENRDDFIDKMLFRSQETNPMEREANLFAAELLMPADEFRRFVNEESKKVEDIADHFCVSALAVRVRAKGLGFSGHGL